VLQVVNQIPSLQPHSDMFVSNDGQQSKLLQLVGTIPITYKTSQYNIPVTIWLPERFPDVPPTCFVSPTQGLHIYNIYKTHIKHI